MATEAQRRANYRNAKNSSGPKTSTGKRISSMNALSHGLSCRRIDVLAREHPEVGAQLRSWLDYYRPASPHERALIERAVLASAQRQRCQDAIDRLACGAGAVTDTTRSRSRDPIALFSHYERAHARDFEAALGEYLAGCPRPEPPAPMRAAAPSEEAEPPPLGEYRDGRPIGYY
jgi:hypothetical protein